LAEYKNRTDRVVQAIYSEERICRANGKKADQGKMRFSFSHFCDAAVPRCGQGLVKFLEVKETGLERVEKIKKLHVKMWQQDDWLSGEYRMREMLREFFGPMLARRSPSKRKRRV
jgi:hypothetical protein